MACIDNLDPADASPSIAISLTSMVLPRKLTRPLPGPLTKGVFIQRPGSVGVPKDTIVVPKDPFACATGASLAVSPRLADRSSGRATGRTIPSGSGAISAVSADRFGHNGSPEHPASPTATKPTIPQISFCICPCPCTALELPISS